MSKRKAVDLPATCSVVLGLERAMGVTKSRLCQSSTKLRSLKAGTVLLADVGEAGLLWHSIEDKPTQGHCDFQCPACWQIRHGLVGDPRQHCAKWPFRPHLKQPAGEVVLG